MPQIDKLADALKQLEMQIPLDIAWVLRIDGHTDIKPITNPTFPSNWELSSARAISVVRYLIDQGIPPNRLVAAGFGEFQPLDPGDSDDALRKNRRIELKLTER
jgi:chemotaxis protein MotB